MRLCRPEMIMRFGFLRAGLLAGLGVLAAGSADATALRVEYAMSLAGLAIGNASLTGTVDEDRYALKIDGQLTGIAGALSGGTKGAATATGTASGTRLTGTGFAATGRSSSGERTLQIGLSAGNVTQVEINPPFELRPDSVPLRDADRRGVVDPLTALVTVPGNRARPLEPANCNRTIPVFEGTQRFDVILSFAQRLSVKKPGYDGEVLVCNARYVPIAGHRPERPAVKFMTESRDMSVWLAPAEGGRVLVPIRIAVATMLGTTIIEAQSVQLGAAPDTKAPAGRPPTR
jgi:hypothetical protein